MGSEPVGDVSAGDNLELELRHLPSVDYVAMTRQGSVLLIELGTDGTAIPGEVAAGASRVAERWLDCGVEIRIIEERSAVPAGEPGSSLRVQLLAAVADGAGSSADQGVQVPLADHGRRSVGHAAQVDLLEVAQAALGALWRLGFAVPFEAEAVHLLPDDLGAGVLVVLHDPRSDEWRHGTAPGRTSGETVARAVLNGLNRYLQAADRRAEDG